MRAVIAALGLTIGVAALVKDFPAARFLSNGWLQQAPGCAIPLRYHLGSVDPRFDLARADVARALNEAVAMWETATDESLFRESANAGMVVTLVFDERQATANTQQRSRQQLGELKRELRAERERIDKHRKAFIADREAFEEAHQAYQQRRREHRRAVAAWKAGEIERTTERRKRLNRHSRRLNARQKRLSQRQQALQARYEKLKKQRQAMAERAKRYNARVDAYNRDAEATSSFQMARFERKGGERSIRVYKASNQKELRLALAHELGHALGITHLTEASAVMNAERTAANIERQSLTSADRRALAESCRVAVEERG